MKKLLILLLFCNVCFADGWKCINRAVWDCNTWRMSVPSGWIVASDNATTGGEHGYAMVYVEDKIHEWKP